jgi:hypothetical protein
MWYKKKITPRSIFLLEKLIVAQPVKIFLSEVSGSHGGEYEDGCLLGCNAV